MINTTKDIKKFINDKSFKKIFVLCGKKSFVTSGAEIFLRHYLIAKKLNYFTKVQNYQFWTGLKKNKQIGQR